MKIKSIKGFEVLDSRGNPTVLVTVNNQWAYAPSGASTGEYEAVELRDGDKNRYNGKGVLKAVENVNKIIAKKLNLDTSKQIEIDRFLCDLDGTPNKGNLGANAILPVSLGCMYVSAKEKEETPYKYMAELYKQVGGKTTGKKLPVPSFNIINGGAHADSGIDVQEFMIQPKGINGFAEQVRAGAEITAALKKLLSSKGLVTAVGDEGGFAPRINAKSPICGALDLILEAIKSAGYIAGKQIAIALDVASSEFYDPKTKKYELKHENKTFTTEQLITFFEGLVEKYPIESIEDPLDQNDWDGYKEMTRRLGAKIKIVGDDFFVTNKERLERGIKKGCCNSILIKLNQIGTLTETLETIKMARDAKYSVMISHRSGETVDTTIADLAVAVDAEFIKTGAPIRGERVAKYNRLMLIEKGL
ncbi:MAG: phosphopyruvate hydratase [Christensenellaceae bacterium]|jgi:enolase|nr:phosphopyruvate hydratase [Christensenellaceae bacterium]